MQKGMAMRSLGTSLAAWALLRVLAVPSTVAFAPPSPLAVRRGGRVGRSMGDPSSSGDVALSSSSSLSPSSPSPSSRSRPAETLTSPAFRVYIEDTDAYGVVYNGNYLRSYERALSHVLREDHDGYSAESRRRWILSSVADQRFRSSPALGEEYVVRGDLAERRGGRGGDTEVWRLEMVTRKSDADDDGWTIHNSATATLVRSPVEDATAALSAPLPPTTTRSNDDADAPKLGKIFEQRFTPYHDEFDTHCYRRRSENDLRHGYHVPLRNAMNFFERSRSNYLGGPDALRRMQEEDDLLWVVTGVDDAELLLDSIVLENYFDDGDGDGDVVDGDDDESNGEGGGVTSEEGTIDWDPAPGQEVIVRTNFVTRRRGMIVECRHRLYMYVRSNDGRVVGRRLLARAKVTIMALRGSTRRPTSKLPRWVLDLM